MNGPEHRKSEPPEGDAYRSVEVDLSTLLDESEPARDSVEIDLSSVEPRASDYGPPPT